MNKKKDSQEKMRGTLSFFLQTHTRFLSIDAKIENTLNFGRKKDFSEWNEIETIISKRSSLNRNTTLIDTRFKIRIDQFFFFEKEKISRGNS